MQETNSNTVPVSIFEQIVCEKEQILAENMLLKSRIAWFERQMYGQKRERFIAPVDPTQLSLEFGEETIEVAPEDAKQIIAAHERTKPDKENAHKGRVPIPADLPRVEEVIEPEEDTSAMTRIGEDITEIIEITPGRVWVRRIVRPRYARTDTAQQELEAKAAADGTIAAGQIVQASLPEMAFPRMKAGVSMLVHILVSKYVDHLPLYRIAQQFARHKLKIPDSTLGNWVTSACEHLLPLYKVYEQAFFHANYLQMDETTLKVLEDGKGKCHLGYLWAVFDPVRQYPFFFYQTGRDHRHPKKLLERFSGTLQADGYSVYETLNSKLTNLNLVNCMAHIRREFFEAKSNDENRANTALIFIQELYKVEREARERQLSHEERGKLRIEKSTVIFIDFKKWCIEEYQKVLPKSSIGQAIAYTLRRMDNMVLYLADGKIEIDNNLVENIIRPVAIGRKNYLFAGSHEAAQRTAMLYTFFALCKHHNINPEEWLQDVLNRIAFTKPSQLTQLLPPFWKPQT